MNPVDGLGGKTNQPRQLPKALDKTQRVAMLATTLTMSSVAPNDSLSKIPKNLKARVTHNLSPNDQTNSPSRRNNHGLHQPSPRGINR